MINGHQAGGRTCRIIELAKAGGQHGFDGFDLADIVAPTCERCGAWIIGEGVQLEGHLFCGIECAWRAMQAI